MLEQQVRAFGQSAGKWMESNVLDPVIGAVEDRVEIERISSTPGKRITHLMGLPVRLAARWALKPVFKTGFHVAKFEHLEESLNELNTLVDENTLLMVVESHVSLSDILPGIQLVKTLRSRFPQIGKFYFPVAASLVRGVQGPGPQLLYSEGTVPLLKDPDLTPLSAVTDNDKTKRKLKPSAQELRLIVQAAKETDSAFLVLAEGKVEGGRYDVLGHMKGMQHVTNELLPFVFQKAHEQGRKVVVLPVATIGTNDMLSAESSCITWRGVRALIQDRIGRPPTLARVIVGSPYEYIIEDGEDLVRNPEAKEEVNSRVMGSIAPLKPFLERGYYDPLTRDYQADMQRYEKNHGTIYKSVLQNLVHFRLLRSLPKELQEVAVKYPEEQLSLAA